MQHQRMDVRRLHHIFQDMVRYRNGFLGHFTYTTEHKAESKSFLRLIDEALEVASR